ncbi:hypothetical protein M407DRAFT_13930 [Tulasnella calospora MUT 4182]|uniref:protein-histidine N-methyltransferase n=1 Tax=Tulasnella calospora MUT 4182 TaxID=1051891 RepID=A0A0C3QJP0_9AGAM|nr:hypothetical protein M407DRAFT_13930 [Tulasnella calospora MUT 4182]
MFKFDFDDQDDLELDEDTQIEENHATHRNDLPKEMEGLAGSPQGEDERSAGAFREFSLEDLLSTLPPKISYSPITVPLASGGSTTLLRRDLFDARFQLIASQQEEENEDNAMIGDADMATGNNTASKAAFEGGVNNFIAAPSDLVPGVYEGGLKTWECSLDLIAHMEAQGTSGIAGKSVLELGCGTALPSMYLVERLLARPIPTDGSGEGLEPTVLCLQDFNASVLQLVTLPNIFLTWSPGNQKTDAAKEGYAPMDSNAAKALAPGDVIIDEGLVEAFKASLRLHNITLRFISGAWTNFVFTSSLSEVGCILTSETIYNTTSVPSLISVMKRSGKNARKTQRVPPLILVAAKVLYFGVGGGVKEFARAVEEEGGEAGVVWEVTHGVGRQILRVTFP